jgi:hypothetical protein
MESAGKERGKEIQERPAKGAKRQQNAKKMLNRRNELKDLLETQDLAILCAKNELKTNSKFRSRESGFRSRESGFRSQEPGFGVQEAGFRSQGNNGRVIGTGGTVDKKFVIRGQSQEEFFKIEGTNHECL